MQIISLIQGQNKGILYLSHYVSSGAHTNQWTIYLSINHIHLNARN